MLAGMSLGETPRAPVETGSSSAFSIERRENCGQVSKGASLADQTQHNKYYDDTYNQLLARNPRYRISVQKGPLISLHGGPDQHPVDRCIELKAFQCACETNAATAYACGALLKMREKSR
jgi:hypothetical protein